MPAVLHHVGPVSDLEGHVGVLFDEKDRGRVRIRDQDLRLKKIRTGTWSKPKALRTWLVR